MVHTGIITPDHYPLGYMLVAYGREKYGNDFWAKTAVEAAAFKGLFYPLQKAIRKKCRISHSIHSVPGHWIIFKNSYPKNALQPVSQAYMEKKMPHFASDRIVPPVHRQQPPDYS